MVKEYADLFSVDNVMNHSLSYHYEQHEANSEESFTGLGIEKINSRTWFSHPSKQPNYK